MFWTIYILERQMGSLQGLPLGISDEVISARFPVFPGQPQKLEALKIHVDFCRVLAKIDQSTYMPSVWVRWLADVLQLYTDLKENSTVDISAPLKKCSKALRL